jgi:hypothetical protein
MKRLKTERKAAGKCKTCGLKPPQEGRANCEDCSRTSRIKNGQGEIVALRRLRVEYYAAADALAAAGMGDDLAAVRVAAQAFGKVREAVTAHVRRRNRLEAGTL